MRVRPPDALPAFDLFPAVGEVAADRIRREDNEGNDQFPRTEPNVGQMRIPPHHGLLGQYYC